MPSSTPGWTSTLVVGLVIGAAAWAALPTTIQAGDAGEFATVMLRGGIPHPSGYPWMRALGPGVRALAAMGLGPATAAATVGAAAGVAGLLVLQRVLLRFFPTWPASLAVAVVGVSDPALRHVPDAEVWGLHLLLCAVVIRTAVRTPVPSAWMMGGALGLACSHHLTAVLLTPLAVAAVWPPRTTAAALAKRAATGIAAVACGLTPFLTLAIGTEGPWRWGDTTTAAGLWRHVTRADYGVFALSLHTERPDMVSQWARAVGTIGRATAAGAVEHPWVGAIVVAGVLGLAIRGGRPQGVPPRLVRAFWVALGLCGLGFPLLQNIDPGSVFGRWILERFDLLTLLLWAPVLAAAMAGLAATVPTARGRRLVAAAGVAWVGLSWTQAHTRGLPSQADAVSRYAQDLLRTPPPGTPALVFGTDDHRLFPVLFTQEVLGIGSHTVYVDASLLRHRWYREHLRRRFPGLPEADKPVRMMSMLWADPATAGTPVYLANVFSVPASRLPKVPEGILWRVVPPDADPTKWDAQQVQQRHRAAFSRYPDAPPVAGPTHPFAADLAAAYREPTRALANALLADGDPQAGTRLLTDLGMAPP